MAMNKCLVLICSSCKNNVYNSTITQFAKNPFFLPSISRGYKWRTETHYDVLGVHPDATQAEIKTAYLKLSKELHPDLNQGATKQDSELIHKKFVKVNQAYSTLSNKRERNIYDIQTLIKSDPRRGNTDSKGGASGRAHVFRDKPMTFEERAKAMGYAPQDPNFYEKHNNYHRKIVLACFVWIVAGAIFSRMVIMALYQRHTTELDHTTKVNNDVLMAARNTAMMRGSVKDQREAFGKKWDEEKEKQDSEMRKFMAQQ